MTRLICTALLINMLIACDSGDKSNISAIDSSHVTKTVTPNSLAGCYQMNIEKDSVFMNLKDSSGMLSGTLVYKRFEKDSNAGIFSGLITPKNHLEGWYYFISEGRISIRQVIFKIGNNTLSEGYGDVGLRDDTVYFKYPSNLRYEENHPLIKMACH